MDLWAVGDLENGLKSDSKETQRTLLRFLRGPHSANRVDVRSGKWQPVVRDLDSAIRYDLNWSELQFFDQGLSMLLRITFGPFQPISRFMAPDLGDFPVQVELANPARSCGW